MDAFFLSPSSFSILFLLTIFQLSYAQDDFCFTSCAPFDCGNLSNISYPFWTDQYNRPSYCGYGDEGYKLKCRPPCYDAQFPRILCAASQSVSWFVDNQTSGIEQHLSSADLGGPNHRFSCRKGGKETSLMFFKEDENECIGNSEQVEIPIGRKVFDDLIGEISTVNGSIVEPFDIRYFAYNNYCKQCEDSGERCGSNLIETSLFVCYCRDHPHILKCNQ
ncbi:hypothetical protein Godav_015148, partial [Gossypium davidsonii]|nr:hypothetical protein [Gossypium davidsonii]